MNSGVTKLHGSAPLVGGALLLIQSVGCTYLPLSDPGRGISGRSPNGDIPGSTSFTPSLGTQELLESSTYAGPDEGVYSIQDKNPVTGTLVDFYPSGQKKYEINFIDGLREGSAQWWTASGQLKHLRNYHKGQLSGSWVEYHEGSEQKRQEQIYDNGIEIMRRGWWINGMKRFEATFLNGEEKSRQSWDTAGTPTHEKTSVNPTLKKPEKPNKQP